jgi:hypothetical protein
MKGAARIDSTRAEWHQAKPRAHVADAQLTTIWRSCDRALLAVERDVSLLLRCCPTNAASEHQRLLECWRGGEPAQPRWSYLPAAPLDRAQLTLERVLQLLPQDPISRLYADRVQELELERQLATVVGSPALRQLATQRFAFPDPVAVGAADALAEQWSGLVGAGDSVLAPLEPGGSSIRSDAEEDPRSLYAQMCRAVGELRLPFRVTLSDALTAAAATGEGVIAIARGRTMSVARAHRIVIHEVYGHVLPRVRAGALPLGLLQVGSRLGNDVQEGWALEMEAAHHVMDDDRRRELGLRHIAAASVAAGADCVETTRTLLERGAPLEFALELCARAQRGGGLGRERIYLPAWCQVRDTLSDEPNLGEWLGAGRLSVDAARVVCEQRGFWGQ